MEQFIFIDRANDIQSIMVKFENNCLIEDTDTSPEACVRHVMHK